MDGASSSMSAASRRWRGSSSPVCDTGGGASALRNSPRNDDGERAGSGDHLAQPEYESFERRWREGVGERM